MDQLRVAAPGRINLLGEHTDYNLGYVLPAAIDRHIEFTLTRTGDDKMCTIQSEGYGEPLQVDLSGPLRPGTGWENYLLGVLSELGRRTDAIRGFDCHIKSDLPAGSGVSSSAALECGLAFGLNELFGLGFSHWELIELCQQAEHSFVGTRCGIMDQFASIMGRDGNAMLLDCRSLDFRYVPLSTDSCSLLLLNSNISHRLAESSYNTRRMETEAGSAVLREEYATDVPLRDLTPDEIRACRDRLGSTGFKRCSYVVEENIRVLQAVKALEQDDLKGLGKLMYDTHEGLRTQYEVSCPELDFLVDFTRSEELVLGSRMMGGGFGGCTLNIIRTDAIESFLERVYAAYSREFNIGLTHFIARPGPGTRILEAGESGF